MKRRHDGSSRRGSRWWTFLAGEWQGNIGIIVFLIAVAAVALLIAVVL